MNATACQTALAFQAAATLPQPQYQSLNNIGKGSDLLHATPVPRVRSVADTLTEMLMAQPSDSRRARLRLARPEMSRCR